jgi:hypothetical protein
METPDLETPDLESQGMEGDDNFNFETEIEYKEVEEFDFEKYMLNDEGQLTTLAYFIIVISAIFLPIVVVCLCRRYCCK